MELNNLEAIKGARKYIRKGRGIGTGNGKTCGKGHKGQRSRSGHMKLGFEGGQNPIYRRLPKFGFFNHNHVDNIIVNLSDLNQYDENSIITPSFLKEKKLIKHDGIVKILANGEIKKKLIFKNCKFSLQARKKIENIGGRIE